MYFKNKKKELQTDKARAKIHSIFPVTISLRVTEYNLNRIS